MIGGGCRGVSVVIGEGVGGVDVGINGGLIWLAPLAC